VPTYAVCLVSHSPYVAQVGLKLTTLLPESLEYWNYRSLTPCTAAFVFFKQCLSDDTDLIVDLCYIAKSTCIVIFLFYANIFWNSDGSMASIQNPFNLFQVFYKFSSYFSRTHLNVWCSRNDFIHWQMGMELKLWKFSFLIVRFIISIDINNENLANPEGKVLST
jgi:hypothetical protein